MSIGKPRMITRSGWGASPAGSMTRLNSVGRLVIHHCASNNTTVNNRTVEAQQKYLQNLHQNTNGWADIGYHYAIGKDGTILEGRSSSYQGAHVAGHNHNTLGIVVHGNYETRSFTTAQRNNLAHLLAWLCETRNIKNLSNITYHQYLASTDCPGKNIISQITTIRNRVATLLGWPQPH